MGYLGQALRREKAYSLPSGTENLVENTKYKYWKGKTATNKHKDILMGDQGTRRHVSFFCFFCWQRAEWQPVIRTGRSWFLNRGVIWVCEEKRASYVHETVVSIIKKRDIWTVTVDVRVWGCSFCHCVRGRCVVSSGPCGIKPIDNPMISDFTLETINSLLFKKVSKNACHFILWSRGLFFFYWIINKNIKDI